MPLVAELVEVMALRQAQGPLFDKLRDRPLKTGPDPPPVAELVEAPSLETEDIL